MDINSHSELSIMCEDYKVFLTHFLLNNDIIYTFCIFKNTGTSEKKMKTRMPEKKKEPTVMLKLLINDVTKSTSFNCMWSIHGLLSLESIRIKRLCFPSLCIPLFSVITIDDIWSIHNL